MFDYKFTSKKLNFRLISNYLRILLIFQGSIVNT